MVRVGAFCLRIGLRHVRPRLGLAVVVGPIAVVHVTRRIDPYQPRTAAGCLGHCRSLGRRRSLSGGGSLRSWSSSWSRSWSWRSGGSCLSCCSRRRLRGSSGCRLTRRGRRSRTTPSRPGGHGTPLICLQPSNTSRPYTVRSSRPAASPELPLLVQPANRPQSQ